MNWNAKLECPYCGQENYCHLRLLAAEVYDEPQKCQHCDGRYVVRTAIERTAHVIADSGQKVSEIHTRS